MLVRRAGGHPESEVLFYVAEDGRTRVEVAPIRAADARLLQAASGSCGFRVERLTFDQSGAFEFVTSIMRGDRYRVRIGLRTQP